MKLQSTLSHESMNSQINVVCEVSNSRRLVGEEIAFVSGALVNAYPFVEKPLDQFFPHRPTARRANKGVGSTAQRRVVDADLMNLSGYLLEFAPKPAAASASVSSAIAVAPVATKAPRGNGIFVAMAAAFGTVAVALTVVIQCFAPATAADLSAGASAHVAAR